MGDLKTRYYEVTVTVSDLAGNTDSDTCKVVIVPSCNPENEPDTCEEYNGIELPNVEDFYYTRSAVDTSVTQSQALSQVAQEKLTWESGLETLNPNEETSVDLAPTPRKAIYEIVDEIDVIVKDTDGKVDGIQDVLTPIKTTVDGISDTIGSKIDTSVAPIETSVSNTESAVNVIRQNVIPMKTTVDDMSSTVGGMSASIVSEIDGKVDGVVLNVLSPMKTEVDGMSDNIGIKIDASVIRSNTYMACSKSTWCQ